MTVTQEPQEANDQLEIDPQLLIQKLSGDISNLIVEKASLEVVLTQVITENRELKIQLDSIAKGLPKENAT